MHVPTDRPRETWTVDVRTKSVTTDTKSVRRADVDSGQTRLPDAPMAAPNHGRRTVAAMSLLGATSFEKEIMADLEAAGGLLERVITELRAEGTPDLDTQNFLMQMAAEAGRHVKARDVDDIALRRERERDTDSPLSAEERAWLQSVGPLQDSLCDLIQRLCIAKAHLEIDPLFARSLAMSVTNSVNIRGSFGNVDQIRAGLAGIGQQIDMIDGVRAQQLFRTRSSESRPS
jgi:hypothetical protein